MPGLPELVGILRELLDLLCLRKDLIAIPRVQLTLRPGANGRSGDVAGDAQQRRLSLGGELVERRLLDQHARTVGREKRQRDRQPGAPPVSELRLGIVRERERRQDVRHAQRLRERDLCALFLDLPIQRRSARCSPFAPWSRPRRSPAHRPSRSRSRAVSGHRAGARGAR